MHTWTHTQSESVLWWSPVLNFLNYSFIKWYNPVWGGTYVSPSVFIMAVTPSQYCGSRRDKRSTSLLNVWTDVFNNWRCTDRARHYYSWVAIFILNNWTSGQEEVWCWFEMWHHCIVLSQRIRVHLLLQDQRLSMRAMSVMSVMAVSSVRRKFWGSCLIKARISNHKNVRL